MTQLPTDARLARRATDGDERAFAAIFRRYHQELYRFCLSIVSRPEDAQDALQNTMVKALRSLPGEERQIELKPWLYRVAHNESIELLRKRRESVEFDPERLTAPGEPAEIAALRERLRQLFDDLELLPERQRGALVMRELGGLGFEQIGEAFATSAAVARQTVYEARLNLRQMEAGREMSCEQVTRQLSEADGRITRGRDVQAHLRACPECRAFQAAIESRHHDLAAIVPLPAAAAGSILQGLLGGHAAAGGLAGGAGGAGGAVSAGAGKVVATSTVIKAVATVAVVATVGVTAADRGGLIDAGLPGGDKGGEAVRIEKGTKSTKASGSRLRLSSGAAHLDRTAAALQSNRRAVAAKATDKSVKALKPTTSQPIQPTAGAGNASQGPPATLPEASQHGQETAAAHKSEHGSKPGRGHGHTGATGPHSAHGGSSKSHGAAAAHSPHGGAKHESGAHSSHGSTKHESSSGHEPPSAAHPAGSAAGGKGSSHAQAKAGEPSTTAESAAQGGTEESEASP